MQTIIVDMTPGFRMPTIYYSQGDVGTQFAVDLRSRFGDSLPAGATVTIQATKPSGFGFSEAATSVTNGVAVFTTVAGMTDEAGRFAAELKVEASGITLFTANFYMNGEASTHPEGTIDGSEGTVIPELTQLVERAEEAASSVLDRQTVTNTLPAGSQASYTFDEETNTQTFGIPQGEAGAGAAGVTASAYSSSSTYAVGDYVIHNSNLYRCTTAITTAEAFTAAHWTQVVLADDVTDVKSDISGIANRVLINGIDTTDVTEGGYWNFGNAGAFAELSTYNACNKYVPISPDKVYSTWLLGNNGAFSANTSVFVCWYDGLKNFISGKGYVSEFTPPSNARYMRMSYQSAYSFVMKEGTSAPTEYTGYSYPMYVDADLEYERLDEDEAEISKKAYSVDVTNDDFDVAKPVTNLITNGNFAKNANWSVNYGLMTISSNTLTATGNGANKDVTAVHTGTMVIKGGEHYYFHAKMMCPDNTLCKQIRVRTCGDYGSFIINDPISNKWYDIYGLCTIPSNVAESTVYTMLARHSYEDAASANGKSCKVKDCILISLNEDFGLGVNPHEYLLKRMLQRSGYFEGTQDIVIKNSHDDLMLRIDNDRNYLLDYRPPQHTRPRKACVTFICDDGYYADYEKLRRFSEEYNAPFTSAIYKNSTMPISVMLMLQDDFGWELCSHTYDHSFSEGGTEIYLDDLSEEQIEYEFRESRKYMEQRGLRCSTIVYPNGRSDERVRRIAKKYFKCGATTIRGFNDGVIPSFYLNRYPLGAFASGELRTFEGLKALVDQANTDNSWLIFMLHPADEINQGGHTAEQNAILGQLIQYINSIDVDIRTFTDAYEYFANAVEIGDYTGGSNGIAISGIAVTKNI